MSYAEEAVKLLNAAQEARELLKGDIAQAIKDDTIEEQESVFLFRSFDIGDALSAAQIMATLASTEGVTINVTAPSDEPTPEPEAEHPFDSMFGSNPLDILAAVVDFGRAVTPPKGGPRA